MPTGDALPIFHHAPSPVFQALVEWEPEADSEDALISFQESTLPARPVRGLVVKAGQVVACEWVGQTLRISAVVADPPSPDTTPPVTDGSTVTTPDPTQATP